MQLSLHPLYFLLEIDRTTTLKNLQSIQDIAKYCSVYSKVIIVLDFARVSVLVFVAVGCQAQFSLVHSSLVFSSNITIQGQSLEILQIFKKGHPFEACTLAY